MKTNLYFLILLGVMTLGAMTGCEKDKPGTEPGDNITEILKSDINPETCYPERGKYGPNILAEGLVEAKATGEGRFEYSVRAETPKNSSLKIVIKSSKPTLYFCTNVLRTPPPAPSQPTPCGATFYEWHEVCPECEGVNTLQIMPDGFVAWNPGTEENWLVSIADGQFTFTVYEDGKRADASVILFGNFIIEYYENGSIEPTRVKEVKVNDSVIYPEAPEDNNKYDGAITYPETGKYGPNILAEGFVEAKATGEGRFEYSVRAELSKNSSLKIVLKSSKPTLYFCTNVLRSLPPAPSNPTPCGATFYEWHDICPKCGGTNTIEIIPDGFVSWNPGSEPNWKVSAEHRQVTFTVYEHGKPADALVIFGGNCIIEYYENGAIEPTRVKEVKVID